MKKTLIVVLIILGVGIILQVAGAAPVAPNESEVVVKINKVTKLDFPFVKFEVEAETSVDVEVEPDERELLNFVRKGRGLVIEPEFVRNEKGKIVHSHPKNIKLFKLYDLKQGKKIRVRISVVGDERGAKWIIRDFIKEEE